MNFDPSTGAPSKFPSHDKWLFGGQVGVTAKLRPDTDFRFAVAYYDFTNVQGQVSSPCDASSASNSCDTDLTRPSFAQKGNTYMPIRNIVPLLDPATICFRSSNISAWPVSSGRSSPVPNSTSVSFIRPISFLTANMS